MSDSATILTEIQGRVLYVQLHNPPDNRITISMLEGLDAALDGAEADEIELVVIRGGKNTFSKGFDLTDMGPEADQAAFRKLLVLSNNLFTRFARFP
jgi:enoyl-CoA hydratase/carnithine racemase